MSKAVKLKNDNYLDSTSIVHNKKRLSTILEKIVIIETITNENGTAIKFSDGTMICMINKAISLDISSPYGALYTNTFTWTYPVAFASNPVVDVGMFQWGEGAASWGTCFSNNNTTAWLRILDAVQRDTGTTYIKATAIGRWK